VSSDLPENSSVPLPWQSHVSSNLTEPRSKPQPREWLVSFLLFAATVLTTTFAGLFYVIGDVDFLSAGMAALSSPSLLLLGLPFSIPVITILLAHEMGHFLACRYYRIHCTPPYFIPVPISITGTLGAFIKIKSQFQNKRALFDVGVAGPLAGFLFVLPTLWIGIAGSKLIPKGAFGGGLNFGEPVLFRWFGKLVLGYSPATQDMIAHPTAMAAWFGLLLTSLNLFPIWQLDGGHIAYAVLGRKWQKKLTVVSTVGLVLTSFLSWPTPSYLVFGLLLLGLGARFRFYHPPTLSDDQVLGRVRILVGFLALTVLLISFTPIPISFA